MATVKKTAQNTQNNTVKKEFSLLEACVLWRRKGKNGKFYFTGKDSQNDIKLVGWYNTLKQNPKEPDLRLYADKEEKKDEVGSFWMNTSENGKQYLTGYYFKLKVVAFINKEEESKKPYIRAYFKEVDKPVEEKKEEKVKEENVPF